MANTGGSNRSHRVIGWISGIGCFLFIGVPIFAVCAMGECIPRDAVEHAACLNAKRAELRALLIVLPMAATLAGWAMYRLSRFYDGPRGA